MIIIRLFPFGTVGVVTALLNLPLFFVGGKKIGMKFFVGSLIGTFALSAFLDLFSMIPTPKVEPIIAALYGGVLGGAGLGIVFTANASTGGSDIIVRLLKSRYRNMPIGQISFLFDFVVAGLTGIVFHDVSNMLYSLIAVLATSQVIDAVVYRFDYSKVALIISKDYAAIATAICDNLDRGVHLPLWAGLLLPEGYQGGTGSGEEAPACRAEGTGGLHRPRCLHYRAGSPPSPWRRLRPLFPQFAVRKGVMP